MNRKVFFVILALLVIVYIVVFVVGISGGDGDYEIPAWARNIGFDYDDDSGEIDTGSEESNDGVGDRLSKPLVVDDLGPTSSFCRSGFSDKQLNFKSDQSKCDFIIKESGAATSTVRKLALELMEGGETRVLLEQEGQLTVDENLTSDSAKISLDVFDDGGQLSIECATSEDESECQIALE